MAWLCQGAQHQGNRRRQEDRWSILDGDGRILALVADGMGGMPLGAEAAEEAVKTAAGVFTRIVENADGMEVLLAASRAADRAVWVMADREGLAGSVGTTLVAVLAEEGRAWWLSVGDSRVYLFRKGALRRLSRDHTLGEKFREATFWGPPEAITSFIGIGGLKEISRPETPFDIEPGDRLILASDGLFNTLEAQDMTRCLQGVPENPAGALVQAAVNSGNPYQDNVTAVTLTYCAS